MKRHPAALSATVSPRRVPAFARASVLIVALMLASSPAQATPLDDATDLVSAAIGEHRLFQSCYSLLPRTLGFLTGAWTEMAAASIEVLARHPNTADLQATLAASAEPGALLPDPLTPFSVVVDKCHAQEDLERTLNTLRIIQLPRELERVLEP